MFVPSILAGTLVNTWFKSMRTLYGHITKPRLSGAAAKVLTARQHWMSSNFKFLASHVTICTPHSQLGRVPIPASNGVSSGGR